MKHTQALKKYCLCFIAWLFCSLAMGQTRDIPQIKKLVIDYNNAYLAKDTVALGKILSGDMIQITGAGDMLSKKEILQKLAAPNRVYKSITIDSILAVSVFDNTSIITIKSTVVRVLDGTQSTIHNCYSLVFRKRRMKWEAVLCQVTILSAR